MAAARLALLLLALQEIVPMPQDSVRSNDMPVACLPSPHPAPPRSKEHSEILVTAAIWAIRGYEKVLPEQAARTWCLGVGGYDPTPKEAAAIQERVHGKVQPRACCPPYDKGGRMVSVGPVSSDSASAAMVQAAEDEAQQYQCTLHLARRNGEWRVDYPSCVII